MRYDVFISYTRRNQDWVEQHLYERLKRCRTHNEARPPRIFLDVKEDAIPPGMDFMDVIADAIAESKRVIPIYSAAYFESAMCRYEISQAHQRDPDGRHGLLAPVLIETDASSIPTRFRPLNFIAADSSEWFDRLCRSLELTATDAEVQLKFESQPGNVFSSHTLPAIRVRLEGESGPADFTDQITILAEHGELAGTLRRETRDGAAVFDDLSLSNHSGTTRLIVRSDVAGEAYSEPFTVHEVDKPHDVPSGARPNIALECPAESIEFLADGTTLAVIEQDRLQLFNTQGEPIPLTDEAESGTSSSSMPLDGQVRVVRRRDNRLMLADWSGNVYQVRSNGQFRKWSFATGTSGGFYVPVDIDAVEGAFYVSFWSGVVYRISDEQPNPQLVLRETNGIQGFGAVDDRMLVWDFLGNLRVYRRGKIINTLQVEPVIHFLKDSGPCLLGISERRFYHIQRDGSQEIHFDIPVLSRVDAVYEMSNVPVAIDSEGRGVRFGADLVVRSTFHTTPGAVPASADDAGQYCIFRNLDGTHTLMTQNPGDGMKASGSRIDFSHPDGVLAVAPDARHFAMTDPDGLQILSAGEFESVRQ